jgi:hypothetical protein
VLDPAALRLDLPARWLDARQFQAALAFDRDTSRLPDLPVSTLEAPWAWRHYRERTRYWRSGP